MIYKNAYIATKDKVIFGFIEVNQNGRIIKIQKGYTNREGIDCEKNFIIPSFIDSHTHGGYGLSFDDFSNQKEYLTKLNHYLKNLAKEGVGCFVPTNVSLSLTKLNKIVDNVQKYLASNKQTHQPKMVAWFFEGPFIAKQKKGAHNEKVLIPFNEAFIKRIIKDIKIPKIVALAPEVKDNFKYFEKYKHDIIFALGHSNASEQQASACFEQGMNRVIHLYNAMSGFDHREGGIVNAILNQQYPNDALIELISDGVHVSNKTIKLTHNIVSANNLAVVSDCLEAKGLKDGNYQLGALKIEKKSHWCYLKNTKTLAGSACSYNYLVKNYKKATNCSWQELVRVSSYNNAKSLGLEHKYGIIKKNQLANFIVVDENVDVLMNVIDGKVVYQSNKPLW